MVIRMEQRYFQKHIRHSLLAGICEEAGKQVQRWRNLLTTNHQSAMMTRDRMVRVKRQHKLALMDVAAMKSQ